MSVSTQPTLPVTPASAAAATVAAASLAVELPSRVLQSGSWRRRQRPWVQTTIALLTNPIGAIGFGIILLLVLVAVFAPLLAPYDPREQHITQQLQGPSATFLLGSDNLGRDLLSRIIWGARISFEVGILATVLGAIVGVGTGLVAGYLGGWVDTLIMRCYDALLAFPGIILGIGVISILGPSSTNVAYALAIGAVPGFARLTRSCVLSERERDYVHAARCLGAPDGRIMLRHVLPNTVAPLLVQLGLSMGFAVLAEAGLSFLGLGTQPPDPSWGTMLSESRSYLRTAPWFGLWPGVALTLLLIGLNFFTDALRDALDPHRLDR